MNNNEVIKSARKMYFDKNKKKLKEYAQNKYHSGNNKKKQNIIMKRIICA